jgi:hypothetical protein
LVGGRQAFINEFVAKKAVPIVLMFYCSVTGHTPRVGVVVPMIVKQMTGIGLPTEQLDLNTGYGKLVDLFNDYLHDRID